MDFNPNVDDFNSTYPNVQPYESRGDNRYYIAAAWNDVSEVPNRFTAGDESRTMAMRSGVNETYFNAKLDRFTPHCYYVIIHHILSIGDVSYPNTILFNIIYTLFFHNTGSCH